MKKKGFTLIEVMVVMAIIAVLSVLIIGAITITKKQAGYTQATSEMRDLRGLMETYIMKRGQLPPMGDCCSTCTDPADMGSWQAAVNAMRDEKLLTQEIASQYYTDPWGSAYAYDDNFGQDNVTVSYFCTAGPDGRRGDGGSGWWGSGDDRCEHIQHEAGDIW